MGSKDKIIKRRVERASAILIDGVNLDRATKRLNRKVSIAKLIKSLSQGYKPDVIRYYTIIPGMDDSRHLAYLDAVQAAGAEVIVKRLPPIGKNIQIDVYPEMSADMIAFSLGHTEFSGLGTLRNLDREREQTIAKNLQSKAVNDKAKNIKKTITLVCPTRDISYSIAMATEFGVDTVNADFSETVGRDVLKSSAKWIDLSDSELIWRDEKPAKQAVKKDVKPEIQDINEQ